MANHTKNRQQIRHILQLTAQGFSKRSIEKATGVYRPTLRIYLQRWEASGLSWEQLPHLDDEALGALMYNEVVTVVDPRLQDLQVRLPGFVRELGRVGVTRQLLWQEYIQADPAGYRYAQFCSHL